MKKIALLFLLTLIQIAVTFGQIPAGYYALANGKFGDELKSALSSAISNNYNQRSYSDLWGDFYVTDAQPNGSVWDMYSNCSFTFGNSQCGNYNSLCDCYNREHSLPKSWFNDQTTAPMHTDLFHLYPTDGFTNGKRGNFPFGEVASASWTGNNGSKVGSSSFSGYTGVVFEPADEYKGDFARTYFYMATRYLNTNFTYELGSVTYTYNNSTCNFTDYALNLLLNWHRNDPVSQKEINRNNAVFGIQNNRNPYIDYPKLVEHIWGVLQESPFQLGMNDYNALVPIKIIRYPNGIRVEGAAPNSMINIYNVVGQKVYSNLIHSDVISLTNLKQGVYIISIDNWIEKIVWYY